MGRLTTLGAVIGAVTLGLGGVAAFPQTAQAADLVTVASVPELQTAVSSAAADTTIVLDAAFPQTLPSTIALTTASGAAIEVDGGGRTLYPAPTGAHLTATVSGTGSLTLKNLTFTLPGGSSAGNGGVQITQNDSADVTLTGLDLTGLRTTALAVGGGGTGDLTVTDSSFTGNTAASAAALHFGRTSAAATSLFQRTTFADNTGTAGSGYSGGAVRVNAGSTGTVVFEDSAFTGNRLVEGGTQPRGGAIAMHNSNVQLHLIQDYFARNSTASAGTPANADGGAVSSFNSSSGTNGSIFVDSSTFEENEAQDDGAALFIEGRSPTSTGPYASQIVVQNSTFINNRSGNYSGDSGGVIQASLRSQVTLEHNTFVGNTKANDSGIDVGGHLGIDGGGIQSPKLTATNNIFTRAASVYTVYVSCTTNVGCTNNAVTVTPEQEAQLLLDVFGTATPTATANDTTAIAGDPREGRTTYPVTTVRIAPPLTSAALTAYQTGTTPTSLVYDGRGVGFKAVPDAGSLEMEYVKFDQATNGGSWSGQTPTFPQGDSYFTGTDAATGWHEVAVPGAAVAFPPDPTPLALHTFTGWFTEPTGGTQVTGANAAGQTLYAQFAPLTHTVTFDSAGGSAVAPVTGITHGDPVAEPADPTYPGHTFDGWLLNGSPYDFASPVTEDRTLVASWTPVPPVDPDPEPTPEPTPDPTVPPAPVTPDPPSTTVIKPGLAITGPAAVAGIALAAVLLIGAGTAAVAARRRRG